MRVLITGASGMVGQNLMRHPGLKRYDVLCPSRSQVNLLDYPQVEAYCREHKPELIIHAAGKVGGIQANMQFQSAFLLDNMDMGRNVVRAARQSGIRKLLNIGSSCMYPRHAANPLREEFILQGELEPTNEGYALAKIATARLCRYIHAEDASFCYKTVIPCNMYGPWDKFDPTHSHLLAAALYKIHRAKQEGVDEVTIWGDGTARREFMYAGDFADFLIYALAQFDNLPDMMNVGCGFDYTVNEYYRAVAEVVDYRGGFVHDLSKEVGMKQKLVDTSRLRSLGWTASTGLAEGIAQTYQWLMATKGEHFR
ncbi:GDP-fucose synthetase [Paenibacillus sp. 598K]|uniref:GDP-L-fucose synthase family protein n=1 Tax=Paenibacillus sp. 598K TaxID=1117987 RepID=UPI000FF9EA4F|nr:GDP-L-fucose synthase [Paenibacillus sp. 598K]GBF75932.1 GDP-fucose synthetase [Paenibacillus sp. 598K]